MHSKETISSILVPFLRSKDPRLVSMIGSEAVINYKYNPDHSMLEVSRDRSTKFAAVFKVEGVLWENVTTCLQSGTSSYHRAAMP